MIEQQYLVYLYEEQKIRKLEIYRAVQANDALTVRTMEKVKTVDLVSQGMDLSSNYKVRDNFENGVIKLQTHSPSSLSDSERQVTSCF